MCLFAAPVAAAAVGATVAGTAVGSTAVLAPLAASAGAATGIFGTGLSALQLGSLALSVLGTGFGVYSKVQEASGQQAQMNAEAKIAKNNQTIANWQADDAVQRGSQAELENRRKYAQLAGTQRASFASRGVDLGEGSVLAQLDDTALFESADSNTIKENTQREAWGFRNQGADYGATASMYRAGASGVDPIGSAGNTLLTGATDVAEKWYRFKQFSPSASL